MRGWGTARIWPQVSTRALERQSVGRTALHHAVDELCGYVRLSDGQHMPAINQFELRSRHQVNQRLPLFLRVQNAIIAAVKHRQRQAQIRILALQQWQYVRQRGEVG